MLPNIKIYKNKMLANTIFLQFVMSANIQFNQFEATDNPTAVSASSVTVARAYLLIIAGSVPQSHAPLAARDPLCALPPFSVLPVSLGAKVRISKQKAKRNCKRTEKDLQFCRRRTIFAAKTKKKLTNGTTFIIIF